MRTGVADGVAAAELPLGVLLDHRGVETACDICHHRDSSPTEGGECTVARSFLFRRLCRAFGAPLVVEVACAEVIARLHDDAAVR